MNIVRAILGELRGMFLADMRLAIGIALVVVSAAALVAVVHTAPLAAGGALLVGCLLVLIQTVIRAARCEAR
jgi:hypothetical protein